MTFEPSNREDITSLVEFDQLMEDFEGSWRVMQDREN